MRACLVLIDLQRDFLAHPGLSPNASEVIENIAGLLHAWREKQRPVTHVRTIVHRDEDDRMPHWKQQNRWICVDGTAGAAAPAELEALPGEPVFAKSFFSPFGITEFDPYLRSRAELIIIAGLYTHACVRAAVLDCYQRGYQVWVVSDGIASYDTSHDALTRDYLQDRACQFLSISEISNRLGLDLHQPELPQESAKPLFINGQWLASDHEKTWTHYNPSQRSELLHRVTVGNKADVNRAALQANKQQPQWARKAGVKGVELLQSWSELLSQQRATIVPLLVREIGKPLRDAEAELDYALALLHATINRPRSDTHEILSSAARVNQHPLGVVGLITPWNNPLAIPVGKIAPALLHGNLVIWKPALQSYGMTKVILETLIEAGFPDGCVNMVSGDAATGQAVVTHPYVSAVTFTGSVAAGRMIGSLCASRGKALQAELGGNNGVVIGACQNLQQAADDLARMAFSFAGQRCTSLRRIIVGQPEYDEFLHKFLERAASLRLGLPNEIDTQVGPMISPQRRADLIKQIEQSILQGGSILYGGKIPADWQDGCWFEPTVIEPASNQDNIVQEESFGPVVVVQRAENFETAVSLCNDVKHGLVAALLSDDESQQKYFSEQAQAGILRINDITSGVHPEAPFGGWKASAIGLPEHGRWDDMFYSRPQAVYSSTEALAVNPLQRSKSAWKN